MGPDVATTMNIYGKAMIDTKLQALTKLLEYAVVESLGVAVNWTYSQIADSLVGAERFELPTLCSQSRCATRLRYAPTNQ